jgi:hypothetical protein
MHMLKNGTFSEILQKVKTYIFAAAIVLRLNPVEIKKQYKTEVLYCTVQCIIHCIMFLPE